MKAGKWAAVLVFAAVGAVVATYETVPTHNTDATHFDTLIVLGSPADPDGKVSPEERERVMEAVREFRARRAGHIIVSGGPVHNEWTEGDIMARLAVAAGVPPEDVLVEGHARNTVQNIFFCHQIMQAHGWTSAEVVSSPSHLPRTGLILQHWRFAWRTHASRWPPEYERKRIAPYYLYEALGTTVLRWFGYRPSPFLPCRGKPQGATAVRPCFAWYSSRTSKASPARYSAKARHFPTLRGTVSLVASS